MTDYDETAAYDVHQAVGDDLTAELADAEPAVAGSGELEDLRDGYDDDEEDFAPRPKYKLGALTVLLAAALVAGGGFVAGEQLQKHQGGGTTTAAAAFARRAGAFGGEGGTGGFAGFGGAGTGGTRTGTGGAGFGGTGTAGTGGSGNAGTGTTTAVPVAIGTVVSVDAQTLVLKNFGGQQVTVHLTSTTTVTKPVSSPDLAAGQSVSVAGTTASDGSVTATGITVTS